MGIIRFSIRDMQAADADAVAAWRYQPPYDFYDTAAEPSSLVEVLDSRRWGHIFFSVFSSSPSSSPESGEVSGGEELAGFLELTARPGDVIEIGLGLRPDLTGRGMGLSFVEACLDFARRRSQPQAFALDVATFNQRARAVYEKAGFVPGDTFWRHLSGRRWEFLRMSRPA
ncbi:MAG: GNAT family N-acetyltransferase [Actinomycetota bacterium]|nr:GNAT family N-acetyltransferase [Actinomycetota bacterium]